MTLQLKDYRLGYFHQVTGNHEEFTVTATSPANAIIAAFNAMQNAHFYDHGVFHVVSVKPPSKDIPS